MASNNTEIAQSIADTPVVEEITKAIRRGISVSEILDNERGDWLMRHRGVVVKKQSSLGHPHIYKTFERYFEKMSQYLFFIPVLGRVLVAEKNHKDVMMVETAIINAMKDALSTFDERIGQYRAAMVAHNISTGDYNKSYAIEVKYTSPLDKLYFSVLEKADLCIMLNYNLWVENALNPDYQKNELHRTENEWEIKKLIKNCNYTVIMNYRRLLNSINRDQRARKEEETRASMPKVAVKSETKAINSVAAEVVSITSATKAEGEKAVKKPKAKAAEATALASAAA